MIRARRARVNAGKRACNDTRAYRLSRCSIGPCTPVSVDARLIIADKLHAEDEEKRESGEGERETEGERRRRYGATVSQRSA